MLIDYKKQIHIGILETTDKTKLKKKTQVYKRIISY